MKYFTKIQLTILEYPLTIDIFCQSYVASMRAAEVSYGCVRDVTAMKAITHDKPSGISQTGDLSFYRRLMLPTLPNLLVMDTTCIFLSLCGMSCEASAGCPCEAPPLPSPLARSLPLAWLGAQQQRQLSTVASVEVSAVAAPTLWNTLLTYL